MRSDVFCPSGKRCRLPNGSSAPWAFMPAEITQILKAPTIPKSRFDKMNSNDPQLDFQSDKSISP